MPTYLENTVTDYPCDDLLAEISVKLKDRIKKVVLADAREHHSIC